MQTIAQPTWKKLLGFKLVARHQAGTGSAAKTAALSTKLGSKVGGKVRPVVPPEV